VVLHGFKSQGSKTRSVDSKFAAPYIGSLPFVISRLRNNQVAFGAKQTSSSRPHRLDKSELTSGHAAVEFKSAFGPDTVLAKLNTRPF
jgi:hypothetical protein